MADNLQGLMNDRKIKSSREKREIDIKGKILD